MSDRNALKPGRPWLRHRLSLGCLAAVALVWSTAALLPGTSDGDRRETLFGVGAGILTAVMAFEAFLRWSRRRGGGTLSRAVDGGGDERDRALWGRACPWLASSRCPALCWSRPLAPSTCPWRAV